MTEQRTIEKRVKWPKWTESPLEAAKADKTAWQYLFARDLKLRYEIQELRKENRALRRLREQDH